MTTDTTPDNAPYAPQGRPAVPAIAAILAACSLIQAAFAPGISAAPGSVTLRYGMKSGLAYDQAASMALELKVDPSSLSPAMMGMLQSMVGDLRQEVTLKGRIDVGSQSPDGGLALQYRVVDAKAVLTRSGQVKEMPGVSAAVGRPPVSGQVSADRRRVEIDLPAGAEGIPQALRDQVRQALPDLPEKAMKVGDTFDVIVPMTLPGVGSHGTQRADSRWRYTLRSAGPNEALFDVNETLPKGASLSRPGGPTILLSGGANGTATFSLADGLFTSMKLETSIQMTVTMPFPQGLAAGGAQGGSTAGAGDAPGMLEVKSTIQGPITMGTSRATTP